jgi:hypothetical protein
VVDTETSVQNCLTKNKTPKVPQPPYSPDFSPADFLLFPKLKVSVEGLKFQSAMEI